jgi:transposase
LSYPYFVRVTKREKRACRGCEQGTVTMGPLEPRLVEKGLASDAVVINAVIFKYCDHLPLYRQAAMLERETGLEIGRATLDGWVMRVGELLQPVVLAMHRDLLSVAAKKGTSLAVERDPGVGLRSGLRWAQK